MDEKTKSEKEMLEKAKLPNKLASIYHPFYKGKIEIVPKCPVRTHDDFAIWYTPGVAEPCKEIHKNPEEAYSLTNKWNNVAIVTDGTRVLGLGDIGPLGAMPVMEGKSLLFKYLGGVDAFPICLNTKHPDEIIQAVKWITPSFGGVNLEDIAKPKCFYILERLRKETEIPVWHDDQQGTAAVVLAGFINALKVIGKKKSDVTVSLVGSGASNINIAKYIIAYGVKPGNIFMVDRKGILTKERKDLEMSEPVKWEYCLKTNDEQRTGGIEESMKGVDACIAASTPGPGVIQKEWVKNMADDAIVFPIANPVPEIWPWEAKEAGARIVATGRSDFPNQINNSLGFPGIFRGALEVRAKFITDGMCLVAAESIADAAEEKGLSENYIIPPMEDQDVFIRESVAIAMKAIDEGVARIKRSRDEIYGHSRVIIERAHKQTALLMKEKIIRPPPKV
ncbi:MAG: NADP-dependent malic enzyme [Thermoplasmata archaeon]|nr:NADP-dependent malic enzyme [Thermoplasmata archaeon]